MSLSEREFTDQIVELAGYTGWMVHHDRPARLENGEWRTAIQGDAGFPDLVLARNGEIILVELKTDTGTLHPGQLRWAENAEVEVWRPEDWDAIVARLAHRVHATS